MAKNTLPDRKTMRGQLLARRETTFDGATLLRTVAGRLLNNGAIDPQERASLGQALAIACAEVGVDADNCTPVKLGLYPRDSYAEALRRYGHGGGAK